MSLSNSIIGSIERKHRQQKMRELKQQLHEQGYTDTRIAPPLPFRAILISGLVSVIKQVIRI